MPPSYDEEGNYIGPEGFDPERGEWKEGFEDQRSEWERQYNETFVRWQQLRSRSPRPRKADAEASSTVAQAASGGYTAAPAEPSGALAEDDNEALRALRGELTGEG